jgi:hypothetical protein
VRPEISGIAAARKSIDAALRGQGVVSLAVGFLSLSAAGALGHFFLPFADGALGLRGEFGL